ncbi:MAG: hypothetical protein WBJ84_05340 [Bacteroidales bacterium]
MKKLVLNKILILSWISLFMFSCQNTKQDALQKVKDIRLDNTSIKRYEADLFSVDTTYLQQELLKLQAEYIPFLDVDLTDDRNIDQIRTFISDTLVKSVFLKTRSEFKSLQFLEEDLTLAFKHIKYHFPDWTPPQVYSYISGLDYENPVSYNGDQLIIALDMYLGQDFETYLMMGFPKFKINRMTREYMLADCIREIIITDFTEYYFASNLIDKMLYEGRQLYLMDQFIPWIEDQYKIGFTKEQLGWCKDNEAKMWAYFLENELLFSSDPMIINKFTNDGPFTTAFRNDSPARAAIWVGWQIIESYMKKNPSVNLQELFISRNTQEIFNMSGYKPSRTGL